MGTSNSFLESLALARPWGSGSQPAVELLRALPVDISARHDDPFAALTRHQRAIERELQFLLDVQSARLEAQLGESGSRRPTRSDHISSTSDSGSGLMLLSDRHSEVHCDGRRIASTPVPVRQPASRPVSLVAARKGILRGITSLREVKEAELGLVTDQVQQRQTALRTVREFDSRRQELERSIAEEVGSAAQRSLDQLVRMQQALRQDVQRLEDQLEQMKARDRQLEQEIMQRQSSVDAQLSSYKASLALVERQSDDFLRSLPPQLKPGPDHRMKTSPMQPSELQLHAATEQWEQELRLLTSRQSGIATEITALRLGGSLWREAIGTIQDFEKQLSDEIGKTNSGTISSTLVSRLGSIIRNFETSHCEAESSNWNLIICCLGAELAALREAQQLLCSTQPLEKDQPHLGQGPPQDEGKGNALTGDSDPHDAIMTQSSQAVADQADCHGTSLIPVTDADGAQSATLTATPTPEPLQPLGIFDLDDEPDPAWL